MEKAHLYEALYLVNHGIDEAVRGVQRLKKSPKLLMETYLRGVERERKLEGKPPLVQFLTRSKRPKKTTNKSEGHSSRKVNASPTPASGVKSTVPEDAHA